MVGAVAHGRTRAVFATWRVIAAMSTLQLRHSVTLVDPSPRVMSEEKKDTGAAGAAGGAVGAAAGEGEVMRSVCLVSQEGEKFVVDGKIARMSELVKTMANEEAGEEDDGACAAARRRVLRSGASRAAALRRGAGNPAPERQGGRAHQGACGCVGDARPPAADGPRRRCPVPQVVEFCTAHRDDPMPDIAKVRSASPVARSRARAGA